MNWRLGLMMLAAIPLLAAAFWALTRALPPLAGYGAGLCLYWLLIGAAVLRSTGAAERAALLAFRPPGRLLGLLGFVPVVALAWIAMGALQETVLPAGIFLLIAAAALTNGTLEELFWRGAILPRPDREGVAVAVGLFTVWHVALLFAAGIDLTGGPVALLLGALVLGTIFMAMRLRTGTVGAAMASHVGVNLFAFTDLVARNWPAA